MSGTHYFDADPGAPLLTRPLRAVLAGRERDLVTASGVFSADRVDAGTAVLLRTAGAGRDRPHGSLGPPGPAAPVGGPERAPVADGGAGTDAGGADPGADVMDLGCGWGPVALSVALARPAARVWAVDVNPRALALTAINAERLGLGNVRAVTPDQVPGGVVLGALWSNPPIRVGKALLHEMLARWLGRLHPDGEARLVVQRNLGADSLARWLAGPGVGLALHVDRVATSAGYRVLRVAREGAGAVGAHGSGGTGPG